MRVIAIPKASLWENLRFNLRVVLPNFLQGLFIRRPRWVAWYARRSGRVETTIDRMRKKYPAPAIQVRMLFSKTILVLDPELRRNVLVYSPRVFAEPRLKRRGMSRFQPQAVTISSGDEWLRKRAFNDRAVGSTLLQPPFDQVIVSAVGEVEVPTGEVGWQQFDDFFLQVSMRVLFGRDSSRPLFRQLRSLMHQANRPFFSKKRSRDFASFLNGLNDYCNDPDADSIVGRALELGGLQKHELVGQIPHWMFAMRETLSINVVQTLILLANFHEHLERVHLEVDENGAVASIHAAQHLQHCLQEGMRLWPSTPMLTRQALHELPVRSCVAPGEIQVLLLTAFDHRDNDSVREADQFDPDRWVKSDSAWQFNHLSNGTQACAGRDLVHFLGKSILAHLIRGHHWDCKVPIFEQGEPLPQTIDPFSSRFRVEQTVR